MNFQLVIIGFVTLLGLSNTAIAAFRCGFAYHQQSAAVKKLVRDDAYLQWLQWEQTANFAPFHKPTKPVLMPISKVDRQLMRVRADSNLPQHIIKKFKYDGLIAWVKHPHNTNRSVPFLRRRHSDYMPAYYTASRSMGLTGDLRGFTLKVPTNRPHGPEGELQTGKANTADDVFTALLHSDHIKARDAVIGEDPVLIVLPEVLTVSEKKSKIGYVLRDVRQTDDGHYYLPALSIPYVGRQIARLHGGDFDTFWGVHFAKALGQAKARLLLRYGLQLETPNAQNMLIQLDRDLKPTGKIAFRDISDSYFVKAVAEGLGFQEALKKDSSVGYAPHQKLQPYVSNSLWRMDEAGDKSVSGQALQRWTLIHNRAYIYYILRELDLDAPNMLKRVDLGDRLQKLYELLESPEGQAALRKYREQQDQKKNWP